MLALGPLGPQYSLLFDWHELGRQAHLVMSQCIIPNIFSTILTQTCCLTSVFAYLNITNVIIFVTYSGTPCSKLSKF